MKHVLVVYIFGVWLIHKDRVMIYNITRLFEGTCDALIGILGILMNIQPHFKRNSEAVKKGDLKIIKSINDIEYCCRFKTEEQDGHYNMESYSYIGINRKDGNNSIG